MTSLVASRGGFDVHDDAEAVLKHRFGARPRVVELSRLAERSCTIVARASAFSDPAAGPPTVVLKHLPEETYGEPTAAGAPPWFAEEAATYAFLDRHGQAFVERPTLWGYDPHGVLVLEDLGGGDTRDEGPAVVSRQVAVVLARLHAATSGKAREHADARAQFGLGPDGRKEGDAATSRRLSHGARSLAEWCGTLGIASEVELSGALEPLADVAVRSGPLHALIHDDLARGRQVVIRDGRMFLFDYEHACYAHALRDPVKSLIGKFEYHAPSATATLVAGGLHPRALLAAYREELAARGGPDVDDATWDAAVCDVSLFHLVVQIGWLLELVPQRAVAGHVLPNLRTMLRRVAAVLDGYAGQPDLRRMLALLDGRIAY